MSLSTNRDAIFLLMVALLWICIGANLAPGHADASSDSFGVALSDSESSMITDFLDPLFEALKAGDTSTINEFLSDDIDQKKQMVTGSDEYGKFLQDHYSGSTFSTVEMKKNDQGRIRITHRVQFGSGSEETFLLFLEPAKSDRSNNWKDFVVSQIHQ